MAYNDEKKSLPEGFIDLGEDREKMLSQIATSVPEKAPKIYYPELRFELDSLKELPKSGTALIKYRKVLEREEKTERDGKTEQRYVCEIEVHGIKAHEADESEEKPEKPDDEAAIDKGLEAAENAE